MDSHKLIWLNTREDILDSIADAILSMQESGMYSDDYILEYLDDFINRKCNISFIDFSPLEDKYARMDMFVDLHGFFGLGT